jgi:hypothetical protein
MTRLILVFVSVSLVSAALAIGCGEDSGSARCSADDLELYNLRGEAGNNAMDPVLARTLAEEGCITLPSGPSYNFGPPEPASAGAGND